LDISTGRAQVCDRGAFRILRDARNPRARSRDRQHFILNLAKFGRYFFAFSMLIFGIQHFMYANFIATLITPWIPGHLFWTYFTGVAFIATALAIVTNIYARLASFLLGVMFLLWVLVLHAPRSIASWHNGDEWTSLFVALATGGASLIVASSFPNRAADRLIHIDTCHPDRRPARPFFPSRSDGAGRSGGICFCFCLRSRCTQR
jgi:uncharacterized membrane protein YphA (DoxX/SURF4 family)